MNCLSCGAETTNGLALCETCRAAASVYLEFLPVYFRNLARWRPGRAGSRPVPGSVVLYVDDEGGGNDRITRALDETSSALTGWARMLTDARGIIPPTADTEAEQVALLCRWFAEHLTSIATLDWCGEFVRSGWDGDRDEEEPQGIGYHEGKLRRLTEKVAPGWYAGGCGQCGVGTYVVPGLTWVTCSSCGVTTYARDHLPTILDEARGWVARPKFLAEAVVALVDTELSVPRLYERIHKWGQRERITPLRGLDIEGDPIGPKKYRLGEVLDVLWSEGATRLGDATAKAG